MYMPKEPMYLRALNNIFLHVPSISTRASTHMILSYWLIFYQEWGIKMIFYLWLWDSSRLISFSMFFSFSAVLNLFGIHLICSLLIVDVLSFSYCYFFLIPSQLRFISFSSNWCASLYFNTTTTITIGLWFSVIIWCLSSTPAISKCKTSLHF